MVMAFAITPSLVGPSLAFEIQALEDSGWSEVS